MKKLILLLLAAITMTSCTWVDPDKEGVLVTNFGRVYVPEGQVGIDSLTSETDDFKIVSGKVWTWGWDRYLLEIPMVESSAELPPFKVKAADGGDFTVDPDYAYEAQRGQGPAIAHRYNTYLKDVDPLEGLNNIAVQIINRRIIDRFKSISKKYSTDSMVNYAATYESEVTDSIDLDLDRIGFTLKALSVNVDAPATMVQAISARNKAIQEANEKENQLATALASQKIRVSEAQADLEVARLRAEANKIRQASLTDAILREKWIEKWDGKLPTMVTEKNSGMYLPLK